MPDPFHRIVHLQPRFQKNNHQYHHSQLLVQHHNQAVLDNLLQLHKIHPSNLFHPALHKFADNPLQVLRKSHPNMFTCRTIIRCRPSTCTTTITWIFVITIIRNS
jgi:hypothetical protein